MLLTIKGLGPSAKSRAPNFNLPKDIMLRLPYLYGDPERGQAPQASNI